MARTPNICGLTRRVIESQYEVYETPLARGPLVLGGPCSSAEGLSYDPYDISRCYRVHVRAAWTRNTYWLSLKHANGHWSNWPTVVSAETVRDVLAQWDPAGLLRWAREPDPEKFNWPRIRHYGAKNFKPRNSVTYAKGPCVSVLKRGDAFCLTLRPFPHTITAANYKGDAFEFERLSLLSCRPMRTSKVLAEFIHAMDPFDLVPDAWVTVKEADWPTFLARVAHFFTGWVRDEVMATTPNRVVLGNTKFDAAEDEETRITKQALRRVQELRADEESAVDELKARRPEPVAALEDEEDEPPTSEEAGDEVEDLG